MSKSKSKGSKAPIAKVEPSVLSKTKDMGVTKHSQAPKTKSKDLAKGVADKIKSKKAKVPSPDPSDSESDKDSEDDSEADSPSSPSSASSEDEESEVEGRATSSKAVPAKAAKANGALKLAESDDSDEGADSSDDDESDRDVKAKTVLTRVVSASGSKAKGTAKSADPDDSDASAKSDSESDSDAAKPFNGAADSSDEEDDEDGKQVKAKGLPKKPVVSAQSANDKSDDDSSDVSSSDEDEDSDEEVATKPALKRKAEDESPFAAKKARADREQGSSDGPSSSNLFVGQLAWGVTDEALAEAFQEYGELTRASVMMDKQSGRSRGFGYVEFAHAKDAAKAQAAMHGAELEGRNIKVDFSQPRQEGGSFQDKARSRARSFGDQQSPPSDTLFIGNIAFDADEDAVTEVFTEYGSIMGVRLPTNQDTGAPKGFGYVTFSSAEEAKGALEGAQGSYIAGRPIRLDFSAPRQNNDSPRGGFGGRGGGRGGRGGGRGGFGDRGGRGGFGDRGGRGGRGGARGSRGGSTNRGGLGDYAGKKTTF